MNLAAPASLFLIAWSSLAGCVSSGASHTLSNTELTSAPPQRDRVQLVLETLDDQHIDLADYRGRALLVLAFTTENVASHALARNLEAVARAHPEDLAVVALSGDATERETQRTLLQTWRDVGELRHVTVAFASDVVQRGVSALGPIEHVPTLFFINRVGVIVRRLEAYLTVEQIEALVAPALPRR